MRPVSKYQPRIGYRLCGSRKANAMQISGAGPNVAPTSDWRKRLDDAVDAVSFSQQIQRLQERGGAPASPPPASAAEQGTGAVQHQVGSAGNTVNGATLPLAEGAPFERLQNRWHTSLGSDPAKWTPAEKQAYADMVESDSLYNAATNSWNQEALAAKNKRQQAEADAWARANGLPTADEVWNSRFGGPAVLPPMRADGTSWDAPSSGLNPFEQGDDTAGERKS